MKLTVNGQSRNIPDANDLGAAVAALLPDCSRVIAELNGTIIKKDHWARTPVQEGDTLELVTFVGGG